MHLCIVCRIQYITPPPPGEEGKEKERGKEKRKKDGFKRKGINKKTNLDNTFLTLVI